MDMALPSLITELAEVVGDMAAGTEDEAQSREGIRFRLSPLTDQERAHANGLKIERLERDEAGDLVVWLVERYGR